MTGIQDFLESAADMIAEMINEETEEEVKLSYARVVKVNDSTLNGLRMEIKGREAMPVIYLDPLYESYLAGVPFETVMHEAYRAFVMALDAEPPNVREIDPDYDAFSEGELSVRVLDAARNVEFLKEHPYKDLGNGFVAVCDLVMFDRTGSWRTTVTDSLAEEYDGSVEEMIDRAIENAGRLDPPVMMSMEKMMEMMLDDTAREPVGIHVRPGANSYVLTNRSKHYGAAALFYPGIADKIARKLHGGYYALPSSLSEFIIVPSVRCEDMEELERIVKKVNENTVPEEEILSNRVLRYNVDEKRLEAVRPFEAPLIC